jgi:hypothetical protein
VPIDLNSETKIPLAVAAAETPPGRNGKRCHLSTFIRWITRGARGPHGTRVRLEAVRLGGRWLTSREALQRFAEALTPRLDDEPIAAPRTPAARERACDRAARHLEQAGIG